MPKQKVHKATAKRFRITRTKKVLKRYCGQDHFNARSSGKITRKKRRDSLLSPALHKTVRMLTGTL